MAPLHDNREDIKRFIHEGFHLAGIINGTVLIRLSDSEGSVWTYSSCDALWDLYCSSGLRVTVQEHRCDENTDYIKQQSNPEVLSNADQTPHIFCDGGQGTSPSDKEVNVIVADTILNDMKGNDVITDTSLSHVVGKETEQKFNRKSKQKHKSSSKSWTLRSNTRKRNLETIGHDVQVKIDQSKTKQNKITERGSTQPDTSIDNNDECINNKTVTKFDVKSKKNSKSKSKKKSLKLKNKTETEEGLFTDLINTENDGKNLENRNESETSQNGVCDLDDTQVTIESEIITADGATIRDTSERIQSIETTNINKHLTSVNVLGEGSSDQTFTCSKCCQSFATQVMLDLHNKSIICDRFKCQECGLLFATKDGIFEHKFAKHKKELFQCSICAKVFSTKAHLRCHNNVHTGRYMCSKCKKYFPERRNLNQHRCKALQPGQGSFKPLICEECKCTFSMKEEIVIHNSLYHSGKSDCLRCVETFKDRNSLLEHLKICKVKLSVSLIESSLKNSTKDCIYKVRSENTQAQNDLSNALVTSKPNEEVSLKNDDLPQLLYEQDISLETSSTMLLTNENTLSIDSGFDVDNDKKCNWCKRQFRDSGELLKHVVSCEVFFSEEVALSKPPEEVMQARVCSTVNQHEMAAQAGVDHNHVEFADECMNQVEAREPVSSDSIEQPEFTCNHCGLRYYTKSDLQDHIKIHVQVEEEDDVPNEPQHQCAVCEMTFASVDDLNGHKLTHMQELLQCNLCGKSFTTKGLLRLHNNIHIKSYMCAVCKQYFKEKSRLLGHDCLFHAEESAEIKAVNCNSCEIGLSDEFELECHECIHHREVFKCCVCGRQFTEQKHLMEHFKICKRANEKRDNKCDICGLKFTCKSILESHFFGHIGSLKCKICANIFSFEKAFERHIEMCFLDENTEKHQVEQIYCEICNYYFKTEINLAKHNQIHHVDEESEIPEQDDPKTDDIIEPEVVPNLESSNQIDFQCDLCGRTFSSKAYLKCHNNIHIGRYQCENCKRCFSETRHLNAHFSRCNVNENENENYQPIYCDSCKVYFPSDVDLSHHNRLFHNDDINGDDSYICSHCDQNAGGKEQLLEHLKTCNYRTGKKTNLKEVMGEEFHTKVVRKKSRKKKVKAKKLNKIEVEPSSKNKQESSKIQCPICFKRYTVSYIECHMRTHTNERPYKCPQCPKSFKFKNHIMNHAITHMTGRPYVCEVCGKSFPHPLYLKCHKNMHIRPCRCDICGKTFMTNPQVNRHKLTEHEGRKQHQCDLCGKCYSRSPALVKHKLAQHKSY